ncbi:MAG TPA: glutaredoxin family protein [Steroidobacteraceae bacterium]|nr:glutaredoxin family protein [Steroidobacteraceae bacterium]
MTAPAARVLTLLVREECELCEQMSAALAALARRVALPPVSTADVDSDPQWQRRYGLQVPVLLLDGTPVCRTRLDEAQLLDALRPRGDRL